MTLALSLPSCLSVHLFHLHVLILLCSHLLTHRIEEAGPRFIRVIYQNCRVNCGHVKLGFHIKV